ncbi:uncharacterized protein LOC130654023 isoform X2 [Hydractinia symbiolongicarpus]|uniref:uncharacterized protein LOC130654023 isoform X2 n=1 Tax=Hydractinia symbiolongicarpus TaxID=13093 RepID=UPI00254C51BB|nr:uncharacterized protein LOC130654023 isoform X2 [Hydractinia symbiolongicarpus]
MRKFILLTKLLTLILTDVFTNSNATNEPTLVQPFNFTVFDNVKNFTKIGTIKSTSNATIQYFIVSVESTLEDEFFRKPNWKSITLNGSLIDCMQLVLYDIPRSHFCIDHKTGELYTTPEFSRTKPRVNTTYKITIRAQLNREMFTDQVYNVLVMSECDQITISYNKIPKTNCDNNKMLQLKDISRNTTKVSTFSHSYFVEDVKFYFITSLTVDMTKETAPEAGTTTIYILLKYHNTAQNVSFVFQTSQKYYIDLTPIFDVKSPITIQVELTFFYTDLTGRKINGPYRLNQNLFTFHGFKALNDYCAHSYGNCILSTENYLQTVKKLSHCKRHIDENLYGLKYGNCNGSKLPNVFNTTLELDLPREQMIKIVDGTFIGKGNSYAYNLIRVTGAQDGDFGSGFPRPNECTSEEVYTSPGHFFCINNMNGTIYTTASADNHLKSNDTFLFQMEATTKTLPFRKKRFTLKLTITDLCSPGSQHYTDLITQCSGILLSKPTESLLFPTNELKAILGVRVDASLILLESRSVIIQASVHAINFTKNFTHTIQRYSGQRYYYFSVQDFIFDGKAGNNVRFQIYQASENNFKKIKNIAKDQLAMVYVSNWRSCDLERCLNWYRSWKTGLTLFKDDYRCTEDYRFAGLYYERCLDLEPHFLNGPYAELTIIDGCKYKSVVNLNKYAFYLLNNVTRINITEGKRRRRRRRNAANDPNLLTYDFPRLVLNDFRQQGDIQCALYDIKRMSQPVLSASRKVKFTDPSFLGQPRSLNGTAGLSLSVPGCSLQTEVKLNIRDMFHLRNGTERINLTSSIVRSSNFPRFNFSKLTFADAGSYQCAIFVPGFMEAPITSSPFNITVKELNVTLDGNLKLLLRDNGIYILEGCSFRAKKKLNNYAYILYNGNIRRNLTITSSGNKHTFTGYTINNYEQAGSYQCIIYDPSAMKAPLKSNIVSTNFTVPKFTSNPQPERIPTFAGESMRIIGCGIETDLPLNGSQLYWKKIYNRSTTRLPAPIHSRVMPSFSTIKAKLTDQGTYQCALFIKSLMSSPVLSELTITVSLTALNARFLTQPKIDHTKGLPVVYGCSYHSQRNLASALYYRLNETTRITVIPTNPEEEKFSDKGFDRTRQFSTTGDNLTYNFPNLTIGDYRSIGKYECYIFDPDTMRKEVISTPTAMVTLPAPTFHKAPEYIGRPPKKVGDGLRVGACEFSSVSKSIPISRIYWLKDGFQRIDLGDIKRVQHATGSVYMFPSRDYEISDNSTQGYFQCVVHIPELGVEVKSQKINVQFEDVSDTRVVVRIDQTFTPALLNSSSLEYVALKKKVESQVRVALQNLGATSNKQIVEVIGFSKGSVNAVTKVRFVKISSTTRLNYCDSLKGLVVEPSKDLNVLSVKVNSLDCCFENETGEDSFKGVYHYNKTLVNNTDSQIQKQCRYSTTRKSYRVCKRDLELGPQWSDVDLRKCLAKEVTTQNLEILSQVAVCNVTITTNCSSVDEVAANLSAIVSNGSVITTQQDVTYIANTIKNLVNNIQNALNTEIANDIVKTVSNVLDANVAIVAKAQLNTKSSTSILNDLDELARKLGKLLKRGGKLASINADQPNVALNVRYLERGNITIYSQQINENVRIFITSNTSIPTNIWSSLRIPDVTFPAMKEVLFSYFFRQNSLFLTEEEILKSIYNQSNLTRLIQSTILAGTLGDKHITNLTNPILLKFDKTYYVNEEGKSSCEFWDFTKGSLGSWSSEGCKRINESDDKFITCECTHLTNFAILLDPSQTWSNPIELQIITWIGCGLSLAGLLLTLITFLAFQNLRKKLPPKILICLCFSLLILLIVFLAGVEQTDSDGGCKAVAVLIHYFTLSTFCWMAVEGLNLYRCFVKIFKKGSATKFLKKASLFAWGLPAVIVIVTAAAKPDNLGNDDFCIVAGYSFYFGVLVPVATILLSNFIVLGLVMRGLSTNVMNRSNDNEENRILRQARVAFACATLLGLTWVFGLLAVGKATTFFQWLFCIFNSLQGFFIFLFYTVRNTDVRKEWARCLGISIKGDSTLSTGTDRHEMEKRGEDHHNLTSGVTATTSG